MRWFGGLGLAGLVLGAAACSEPNDSAGPILIQAEEAVHEGSVVMASIKNLSSDDLQFTLCSYRLEQPGNDASWSAAYQDTRPCPAVLEFLKGYATRQIEVSLPADLPAGVYRVRFPEVGRRGTQSEPLVVATQLGGEFSIEQ